MESYDKMRSALNNAPTRKFDNFIIGVSWRPYVEYCNILCDLLSMRNENAVFFRSRQKNDLSRRKNYSILIGVKESISLLPIKMPFSVRHSVQVNSHLSKQTNQQSLIC